mmetsp:Transcript_112185/g.229676  ORF Transcript_112185/g.229676 Transcript_112185/m.229676 type:complete len:364 (-) Transcript_112185:45-1136(-)
MEAPLIESAAPQPAAMAPPAVMPGKDQMLAFLNRGIKVMTSDETRTLLKDGSIRHTGKKLIDIQRAGWDELGIDQDVGCAYLNKVDSTYADDRDLLQLRNDFVNTAQRTYLQSLEDRQPTKLERKNPMPREIIIEFFDACNTKMDLPEFQERLLKSVRKTNKLPNDIIINTQRDLLEVLGFERDHACAMLSRIGQDYANDRELLMRFQNWQMKAQQTLMQVMKKHQETGGELPAGLPQGDNPEMEALQEKAKAEIEKMTPTERGELIQKMQKKVEVFANLPGEARMAHMNKLKDEDKLEFVKTQILLMSLMKQQWAEQQEAQQRSGHGHDHDHDHGHDSDQAHAPAAAAAPGGAVAAPTQQSM